MRRTQNPRHLRPRKPRRQWTPALQKILPHFRTRNRCRTMPLCNQRRLFVTLLFREIYHLGKEQRLHSDLRSVFSQQALRIVWSIKRLVVRINSRTGMIATDDEVVCAEVATNNGVPDRLAWSSHAHREWQQRKQRRTFVEIFLSKRLVRL